MSTEISFTEAPTRAGAKARLRLTRRGRVVIGVLITALVAGALALAALFASPQANASDVAQNAGAFGYVVAQPGDSLWSVATALDPEVDPRDLIDEIVRLNQLDESGVQAGQAIALPLRYADSPMAVSADDLGL